MTSTWRFWAGCWLDVDRLLAHFEGLGGDPRGRYAGMTLAP